MFPEQSPHLTLFWLIVSPALNSCCSIKQISVFQCHRCDCMYLCTPEFHWQSSQQASMQSGVSRKAHVMWKYPYNAFHNLIQACWNFNTEIQWDFQYKAAWFGSEHTFASSHYWDWPTCDHTFTLSEGISLQLSYNYLCRFKLGSEKIF